MKRKLILAGFIGFTFLFGCSQINKDVKASGETNMVVISKDKVVGGSAVVLKHKKTGCYFTYIKGGSSSTSTTPTQMMVEKNNISVPYCDK